MSGPISEGGWTIDVVHDLPTRPPSAAAIREYKKKKREAERYAKKVERFLAKVTQDAKKKGINWEPDEDDGPFAEYPYEPQPTEYAKTDLDRAVLRYRREGDVASLLAAHEMGAKVVYSFTGASGGVWPPSLTEARRDGPQVEGLVIEQVE